jgi:acyl-CoA synthetase (AMP-forming)/AMP-acid ligase II
MGADIQSSVAITRLQQTQRHLFPDYTQAKESIVHGPTTPELWEITLAELLELQCLENADRECLVVPWTNTRWTYRQLQVESERLARGLLASGIQHGDRIGVMAGNCEQYVSLFFAAATVGAILVVINNTYTKAELMYALDHTG